VGRFNDTEWQTVIHEKGDAFLALARQNVSVAESAARGVLGYLPPNHHQPQLANG
jgi:hypothetical protein